MSKLKNWRGIWGKYQYALLVMAVGVLLLLFPTGERREPPVETSAGTEERLEIAEFERRLETVLSAIRGAGETHVVLTVDSGGRKILAEDRENGERGSSTSVVVVEQSDRRREVVPLQTTAPEFRGALVVSPGAEEPSVRLALVEAVSALTGLGADQIAVCTGVS